MSRKQTDQATKRRGGIWKDQHGREWGGTADRMTGMPIGELIPINGTLNGKPFGWWPRKYHGKDLIPSIHYMKFDDQRVGYFEIDYAKWKADLEVAHNAWMDQSMHYAQALYKELAGEALADPPRELASLVGPKPMPPELVEAMIQKNSWILGLSEKRPAWADKFLPVETEKSAPKEYADEVFADPVEAPEEEPEMVTAGRRRDPVTGRLLPKE